MNTSGAVATTASNGTGLGATAAAMVFDGQEAVVTLHDPFPALPAGVTVEFWAFGSDLLPCANSVFAAGLATGARALNIHLGWPDGQIYWDTGGADGFDRIQRVAAPDEFRGSWSHWAFVKDVAKGEAAIYRDGTLWLLGTGASRPLPESNVVKIGAYFDGSLKWSGRLAELRIWDRARTVGEVRGALHRRLTGREPGLVACWPLDRIDPDGTTPDLAGGRPGHVEGATVVPDEALTALFLPPTPGPAPVGSAGALPMPGGAVGPRSVLVEVLRHNEGRKPRLVRLKLKRMAANPFAFFRGSDHLYAAAWPSLQPPDVGPTLPIGGDLHLENFGAHRDDEGAFSYDINDFDEAVVAPCSLDLVRCATSILLASELWKLTPLQASGMVLVYLDKYRATVLGPREDDDARAPKLERGPIWEILGRMATADPSELLDRTTRQHKDGRRTILRSKDRHPKLKPETAEAVGAALRAYGAAKGRADEFAPLDVTGRVAGIGSLGVRRYTVLVAGGGSAETHRLYDVKQCLPSALAPCVAQPWPFPEDATDAARVVHAQRLLQSRPAAGLDVLSIDGASYQFREMIPEENRSSLDRFQEKPSKLAAAVEEAGLLTALAHRRGASAYPEGGGLPVLGAWVRGPALDSVLAAGARFAERTRVAHKQFRAERKAPESLPAELREPFGL